MLSRTNIIVMSLDNSTYLVQNHTAAAAVNNEFAVKKKRKVGIYHTRIIYGPYAVRERKELAIMIFAVLSKQISESKHKETNRWYVYVIVVMCWGEREIMDNDSSLPTTLLLNELATCTRTEDRTIHTIFHVV